MLIKPLHIADAAAPLVTNAALDAWLIRHASAPLAPDYADAVLSMLAAQCGHRLAHINNLRAANKLRLDEQMLSLDNI